MFPIRDDRIRELCQGISDVDYIVGKDIAKRSLMSEQQYLDLEILFSFNDAEKSRGKDPYVQILTDDSGVNYALLSEGCINYALSKGSSLVSESMLRHVKDTIADISQKGIGPELTDKVLEERPQTIDGYLKLYYSIIPVSQKILGDELCQDWKKSDENYLLSSLDIVGGYLN